MFLGVFVQSRQVYSWKSLFLSICGNISTIQTSDIKKIYTQAGRERQKRRVNHERRATCGKTEKLMVCVGVWHWAQVGLKNWCFLFMDIMAHMQHLLRPWFPKKKPLLTICRKQWTYQMLKLKNFIALENCILVSSLMPTKHFRKLGRGRVLRSVASPPLLTTNCCKFKVLSHFCLMLLHNSSESPLSYILFHNAQNWTGKSVLQTGQFGTSAPLIRSHAECGSAFSC